MKKELSDLIKEGQEFLLFRGLGFFGPDEFELFGKIARLIKDKRVESFYFTAHTRGDPRLKQTDYEVEIALEESFSENRIHFSKNEIYQLLREFNFPREFIKGSMEEGCTIFKIPYRLPRSGQNVNLKFIPVYE